MKTSAFINILSRNRTIGLILLVTGVIIGFQIYSIGSYNNYLIFKYSFPNLTHWINLYLWHNNEHYDSYMYSPTFSLFMAPFSMIPDWMGVMIWSLLSCAVFYFSLRLLPHLSAGKKAALFFIVFIELITSVQNMQTNAMIASFMVLALSVSKKKKFSGRPFLSSWPHPLKFLASWLPLCFCFIHTKADLYCLCYCGL
jgi:hypothetical protein